jgi:SAM-dependent methyltransferase
MALDGRHREPYVYCELGAGKSLLAEVLWPQTRFLANLFLLDDSPSMLAYSSHWVNSGAHLLVADVSRFIPLATASVDVVVASLGDPYNVNGLWAEARRVLRPGGRAIYTTPSNEWAKKYRETKKEDLHIAEFELADGRSVPVASHVYAPDVQIALVESHGFVVDVVANVPVAALQETPPSPKLGVLSGRDASVVTGYLLSIPGTHSSLTS